MTVLLGHASASELDLTPEGTDCSYLVCVKFIHLPSLRTVEGICHCSLCGDGVRGVELFPCFENNCLARIAVIK